MRTDNTLYPLSKFSRNAALEPRSTPATYRESGSNFVGLGPPIKSSAYATNQDPPIYRSRWVHAGSVSSYVRQASARGARWSSIAPVFAECRLVCKRWISKIAQAGPGIQRCLGRDSGRRGRRRHHHRLVVPGRAPRARWSAGADPTRGVATGRAGSARLSGKSPGRVQGARVCRLRGTQSPRGFAPAGNPVTGSTGGGNRRGGQRRPEHRDAR